MSELKNLNANRRSFFLRGSAAVGAGLVSVSGVASAVASPLVFDQTLPLKNQVSELQHALGCLEGREAIRQLQVAYTALLENRAYEEASTLFSPDAEIRFDGETFRGDEVRKLFVENFSEQKIKALHTGFRQNQGQDQDVIEINDDQQSATAVFHYQVEVSIPHAENTVIESMARMQGQHASSRWVNGKFLMAYRREGDTWKISRLEFTA